MIAVGKFLVQCLSCSSLTGSVPSDWQLESVAVLLVNSMVGYLCGASDCSRKKESVLIKSLQNFFNLGNHQECFI